MNIEYTFNSLPNEIKTYIIKDLNWFKQGALANFSQTSKAHRLLVTSSPLFQIFMSFHYKDPIPYLSAISLKNLNYTITWIKPHSSFFSRIRELDSEDNKTNQLLRQEWEDQRFENVLIKLLPCLNWFPQAFLYSKKVELKKIAEKGINLFKLAEKSPNLTRDELNQLKILSSFSSAKLFLEKTKYNNPETESFYSKLCTKVSQKEKIDYQSNQELIQFVIENSLHHNLHLFAPDLLTDRNMVKFSMLKGNVRIFSFATLFHNDRELAILALKSESSFFTKLSDELKDDKEIVKMAARQSTSSISEASLRLRTDINFFWELFEDSDNISKHYLIKHFDDQLRDNEELFLKLVKLCPECLEYASDNLKNNRLIVLTAIEHNPRAFRYASDSLRNDIQVFEAMWESYEKNRKNSHFPDFSYFGPTIKTDRSIILRLIQAAHCLYEIARFYKNDPEMFIHLVAKKGSLLQYGSNDIIKNFEIVLKAVKQDGMALKYADNELKSHPEIIEAAVNQNIQAFQFASAELKRF